MTSPSQNPLNGPIDFLIASFTQNADKTAISYQAHSYSYAWLKSQVENWLGRFKDEGVSQGAVVSLKGDFTPQSIAIFLALTEICAIIVPFLETSNTQELDQKQNLVAPEHFFDRDSQDGFIYRSSGKPNQLPLLIELKNHKRPGLVLFSSGSSGSPKAAVHDFSTLLKKFRTKRTPFKTLNFLLFDHWGGLNTLLHTLANAGTVYTVSDRNPETICQSIERHRIEVLPASPSFLNLFLLNGKYRESDLSSLKIISYGTEPMPESTLKRLHAAFPSVHLQQTYGLIELGVLRSKSKDDQSLWVKLGGEGFKVRVVDGLLEIKADSAMLGYLNAPSPFTEDGWFKTGDAVEVDGDFYRVLGRKSELINVGGEKVYPQEVESVLTSVDNIAEATVYGEKNALLGSIVCAKIRLSTCEDKKVAVARVREACKAQLAGFKIPVKIEVVESEQMGERLKKVRGSKHMSSAKVRSASTTPEEASNIEKFLLSIEEFTDLKKDEEKAVWTWLFTGNGRHHPTALIAETDSRVVVGHYGYLPLSYCIDGKDIRAGVICKLAIAAEFRQKPLFLQLNMQLLKKASENGVVLLLGLVNRPGMLEFHQAFGFKKVLEIPVLAKPINLKKVAAAAIGQRSARVLSPLLTCASLTLRALKRIPSSTNSIEIKRIREFSENDDFESVLQANFSVFASRKPSDLNRRFTHAGERDYLIYLIVKDGQTAGYFVLRQMPMREFTSLAIVDLCFNFQDTKVLAAVLSAVDRTAHELKVDLVATLVSSRPLQQQLRSFLFFKTPETFQLIVRENPLVLSQPGRDPNSLWMTWFDNDHV